LFIFLVIINVDNLIAAEYKLAIQPTLPANEIMKSYQPLADYLSTQTGHKITIVTHRNFLSYWEKMKKSKTFDLVFDAAHFTDYRIQRKDYQVIAKVPDTVSFTVVTGENNFVLEVEDLVLKKVATMTSPGLGALRMASLFPNPARLPRYVMASDSTDAIDKLTSGKVEAAIIPTPLVGNYDGLNSVTTTDPVPHMALSSSPRVPADVVESIRNALVGAAHNKTGSLMLSKLNVAEFVPANNTMYAGYADLLEGVFGY